MALRKIGKYYYTYFRDENGKLRTLATGQTVEAEARKIDRANLSKVRSRRQRKTVLRFCSPEEAEKIRKTESESALPPEDRTAHRRGTIRLDKMFDIACKYRKLSRFHRNALRNFIEYTGLKYADQVTPKIALDYLTEKFGDRNGKSFNNHRTYLNTIFKLCLIQSGMQSSPFASILNMRVTNVESYRSLTDDEFRTLFNAATEPYRTAMLISWHTSLRLMDCFTLEWTELIDGWIIRKPRKTSRFRREVQIPIHPELQEHLDSLPHDGKLICSGAPAQQNINAYFKRLFEKCNIQDTSEGKASFHSFRASFITWCDEHGVPRHATKGMTGHVDDDTTDQYSHDRETPKMIFGRERVCKMYVNKKTSIKARVQFPPTPPFFCPDDELLLFKFSLSAVPYIFSRTTDQRSSFSA